MTTQYNTSGKTLNTESQRHELEKAAFQMRYFTFPALRGFSALTMSEYFMRYEAQGKFLQPNGMKVLVSVEILSNEE